MIHEPFLYEIGGARQGRLICGKHSGAEDVKKQVLGSEKRQNGPRVAGHTVVP